MKKNDLLLIEWDDAITSHGWENREEVLRVASCRSVGWLLYKDKKQVLLASTSSSSVDTVNNHIAIPLGGIKKIRRLTDAKGS